MEDDAGPLLGALKREEYARAKSHQNLCVTLAQNVSSPAEQIRQVKHDRVNYSFRSRRRKRGAI
jgi:hypothetical protein